ncbi:hypothetical protein GUJ93_ZPchr0005g16222 [Zizania palustris]|uniref:Uncharacterized protein n=1 Tax=Zizania palustris TaxID=103762 RepID=A0A8J5T5A7_ZIZPA|nr:hypothetical protein GUJ93_ZPchr0005g16222 [Zizania palustris]
MLRSSKSPLGHHFCSSTSALPNAGDLPRADASTCGLPTCSICLQGKKPQRRRWVLEFGTNMTTYYRM